MVEGLVVGVHLIKKHKPKDTRNVMRFANRVLFSMMWEIIVGTSLPNHKNLFYRLDAISQMGWTSERIIATVLISLARSLGVNQVSKVNKSCISGGKPQLLADLGCKTMIVWKVIVQQVSEQSKRRHQSVGCINIVTPIHV